MKKLQDVKTLTTAALLVAIGIVLSLYKIPLSETIQIYFTCIPLAISGFLFGPAIGLCTGVLIDLGGFLVRPTGPFFPGFTIIAGLNGLIYGLFLYKKEGTILQIGIAQAIQTIFSSWIGNTINLMIMYHMPFFPLLISRIPKECIMYPIYTFFITVAIRAVSGIQQKGTFE